MNYQNALSKKLLFQPDLYFIETRGNIDLDRVLYKLNNNDYSKFLEDGTIDFTVDFWLSEKIIMLSFNTEKYNQDKIIEELHQNL